CAKRALGCYVSDDEIEAVVNFVKEHFDADLHSEILSAVTPGQMTDQDGAGVHEDDDPLMWEAAQLVVDSQLGSTSGLQRHLKVGYARAGRIMDMLEDKGIVGPPDGSKPREVLMDQAELEELRIAEEKYQEVE
ncbi:MAG: DNA translocase FtsK, partial [Coriobacteriaceae bacterium]